MNKRQQTIKMLRNIGYKGKILTPKEHENLVKGKKVSFENEMKEIKCRHLDRNEAYIFEINEGQEIHLCEDCYYSLLGQMATQFITDAWAEKFKNRIKKEDKK